MNVTPGEAMQEDPPIFCFSNTETGRCILVGGTARSPAARRASYLLKELKEVVDGHEVMTPPS